METTEIKEIIRAIEFNTNHLVYIKQYDKNDVCQNDIIPRQLDLFHHKLFGNTTEWMKGETQGTVFT